MAESKSAQLCFDPDLHPDETLKAFNNFIERFELRYKATYPDPPRMSMEAAVERWKLSQANPREAQPTLVQYEAISSGWQSKDKVAKILGIYSSQRLNEDFVIAVPEKQEHENASFDFFVRSMKEYYKPTENNTLKHFKFRALTQENNESFSAFSNRIEKEAKHCQFKCHHQDCTAESTAIRDQIVIGLTQEEIRQEAIKKSLDLKDLRTTGMTMESASKGAAEISGDTQIYKIAKCSFKNLKKRKEAEGNKGNKTLKCFYCGNEVSIPIRIHVEKCEARKSKCTKCDKIGHYARVCRSKNNAVNEVAARQKEVDQENEEEGECYSINVFRVTDEETETTDFKVHVVANNKLVKVLADTGAKIAVCGMKDAKRWKLDQKMIPSKVKIKPYGNSPAIPVIGEAICAVSFGKRTKPVKWHIIETDCEPILAGKTSQALGIIKFKSKPDTFHPISMIEKTCENKEGIQAILLEHPNTFSGKTGKLKGYQAKLRPDKKAKAKIEPQETIPYHLEDTVAEQLQNLIEEAIVEEQPAGEAPEWISNLVLVPKDDGSIRLTLNAKQLNKALKANNIPIPRHEDIKAKLKGSKIFSKIDLKCAFWQIELEPESRKYTVFYFRGKLYRFKRLVMGLKTAQAELNAAMQPVFANIPDTFVIHDDLIIASKDQESHEKAIKMVLEAADQNGLTFNTGKCVFGKPEIKFWGLIISADGIRPDPEKIAALKYVTRPKNKGETLSFLCMMQSLSEFIPNFSAKAAKLRELTKRNARFNWMNMHEKCFQDLLESFTAESLLHYFDTKKNTFIIVDAHITGLGAMLAQGDSLENAKPIMFSSRTTSKTEKRYPQIDLEALAVDFGLRRFRNYIIGSPSEVDVVTDHKPLVSVFEGKRKGSIRSERVKLRHQDVSFKVIYQKGQLNQSDYLSRHAIPIQKLSKDEQNEAQELNNLLYVLHTTPVIDCLGLADIAKATSEDETLQKLQGYVQKGERFINKTESPSLRKFDQILSEITYTGNGILLKGERIILPHSLHDTAIQLAHRGAHPGQAGLTRRLRYHFFFHNMDDKVRKFVEKCGDCSMFIDKKNKEPIVHHKIPEKVWDTVAVDLYGPMPSSKHVVVAYDLLSRFPAAKLVSSTKADVVIPALRDIYNTYGNPQTQVTDNGPPFNSGKMESFTKKRKVARRLIPPYHPNANPSETFMRSLGKTLKIGHHNKQPVENNISELLNSYRQTPHPATGVPPAAMMFRDGLNSTFPRRSLSEEEMEKARERDLKLKLNNEEKVNASKYRKCSSFKVGEEVLIRNFKRTSKFDPLFLPDIYVIAHIDEESKRYTIVGNGRTLYRHPDDIKVAIPENKHATELVNEPVDIPYNINEPQYDQDEEYEGDFTFGRPLIIVPNANTQVHRPERTRKANTRYYNQDFINY